MNTPEEILSETIRQAWERVHELEAETKKLKAENKKLKEKLKGLEMIGIATRDT